LRDFRERPLDAGPYTFVAADALTMKAREGGRVIKIAVMIATGVNTREILGVATSTAESGAGWNTFVKDLVARGLSGGVQGWDMWRLHSLEPRFTPRLWRV
jgi:transposase-like protein